MSKEEDKDKDIYESEVEETPSKKDSKPWNRRFGEDESLKNRQYSRTARNQPAKEATTLSKVLLFIIIITVIAPFLLFIFVNAQRDNDEIPNRSAEQINISRNSEISQESSSEDESESESDESESSEESSSEISRESIESVESSESIETEPETPPTPTEPVVPETPTETPTTGGTYTVQAGDSWYAIARNNGVDLYALLNANGASVETAIFPGEVISLP